MAATFVRRCLVAGMAMFLFGGISGIGIVVGLATLGLQYAYSPRLAFLPAVSTC
jgi:hypothetical protein